MKKNIVFYSFIKRTVVEWIVHFLRFKLKGLFHERFTKKCLYSETTTVSLEVSPEHNFNKSIIH